MKKSVTFFWCCAAVARSQAPATTSGSAFTSIRVISSEMVWNGVLSGGTKITGVVDGQPLVLREFKEKNPIAPGTYKIRLAHNDSPHGSEVAQLYTVTLRDGKQLTFYLEALCEREAIVCYGVSVK